MLTRMEGKIGKWRLALAAIGLAGMLTAITAVSPALGASGTATSGSAVRILSARQMAPIVISDNVLTVVRLKVPAGHWLVTGKLYADSVPSTPTSTATLGCTLRKGSTAPVLDGSFFNVPKAPGNTAAGVIYLKEWRPPAAWPAPFAAAAAVAGERGDRGAARCPPALAGRFAREVLAGWLPHAGGPHSDPG